jgi:hypothetical protein
MHICDNPPCVNPDHLRLGTQADNMADMRQKGRGKVPTPLIGVNHPDAKLTEDDVVLIRNLWAARRLSQRKLAARFGVSRSLISQIVYRQCWKHLP